jgi:hypothetical protein
VPDAVTPEELMRYLDGELSPSEAGRVEQALARSSELQREVAIFTAIGRDIGDLSFSPPPSGSLWDEVNRRIARPVGWVLVLTGVLLWTLYGSWVFVTTPGSPWEKLGIGTLAIGFLVLLASTVWERWREAAHDPYRHIER